MKTKTKTKTKTNTNTNTGTNTGNMDKIRHLRKLSDQELLSRTKRLVECERETLMDILHHLREVERRRLFSDLHYESLFEYAVKELKYSDGQAGRRIQAMRLIKEIPEVEEKIASGKLSLSNASQAHSYFRQSKKATPQKPMPIEEKRKVLESLEDKSVREGQRVILQHQPQALLPKERERQVTADHIEVRFVMTNELRAKLKELRSLLGAKGAEMSLAELVEHMTELSIEAQKKKKFGKKRVADNTTPAAELSSQSQPKLESESKARKNPRYISQALKYKIWMRDQGQCNNCGSQRHLNFDHIQPVALGGVSSQDNLRLLCFHCNQRQALKGGFQAARKPNSC